MLCKNLLTLRRQNRWSQEYVAEQIGVTRQAVAKWETGDSVPDIIHCGRLAELYDVTLDDLVNYDSTGQPLSIAPKGKYYFGTVTMNEKGQIVIPAKARRLFDLKPGDDLILLGDINEGLALLKSHFLLDMIDQQNQARGGNDS